MQLVDWSLACFLFFVFTSLACICLCVCFLRSSHQLKPARNSLPRLPKVVSSSCACLVTSMSVCVAAFFQMPRFADCTSRSMIFITWVLIFSPLLPSRCCMYYFQRPLESIAPVSFQCACFYKSQEFSTKPLSVFTSLFSRFLKGPHGACLQVVASLSLLWLTYTLEK